MKRYYQSDRMKDLIDWDQVMKMERRAGGHDDQMKGLFENSEVVAHWNEGDYQGMVATCVKLPDGEYALYNDFYGSCGGCDSWEDATDEEVVNMCKSLANSAYIFNNLEDVKEFLSNKSEVYTEGNFDWFEHEPSPARYLLEEIKSNEKVSQ